MQKSFLLFLGLLGTRLLNRAQGKKRASDLESTKALQTIKVAKVGDSKVDQVKAATRDKKVALKSVLQK